MLAEHADPSGRPTSLTARSSGSLPGVSESGSAAATEQRTRNHAAWVAPILAIFGLVSYFFYFSMWPVFRDFPWLNLLILAASVVLAGLALSRARTTMGRVGTGAGLALSLGLTGLLCFYAFHLSYQLPDAGRVKGEGTPIPQIELASWDGKPVDVAAAASDKLILVFYRGHW